MSQIEEHKTFNLPIHYLENKKEIPDNIKQDLELVEYKDSNEELKNVYHTILMPKLNYGKENLKHWSKYYTTDKPFLKDSQKLYKTYDSPITKNIDDIEKFEKMKHVWNEIKDDHNFKYKFHYIEYDVAQILNKSPAFLELLTLYNLSSPVFSLLLPIFFLIIPFFILKFQGIEITVEKYIEVLRQILSRHALGKFFQLGGNVSWEQKLYMIISIGFYFYQIYLNITSCLNFYNRMKIMHEYIFNIRYFINVCKDKMDEFLQKSKKLKTYKKFNDVIIYHKSQLENLEREIENITPFKNNLSKLIEIGHIMTIFYNLHVNEDYNKAIRFSMDFVGYLDNITSMNDLVTSKQIASCKFTKNTVKFKNAYFAPLLKTNPVKNSYSLDKNILITGPNAAGKTTMLKTTLFNIIFTQQTGMGFYDSCSIKPFDYLHCYLNIPDTSGRDSLFQAEARRCKEIIDHIENTTPSETSFCIFDELYSGTNPYEAVASSFSLLEYLTSVNCKFLLTTHFLELCEKLDNNKEILNSHMDIKITDGVYQYPYKLKSGISDIKGGIKILEGLNYPKSIIERAKESLKGG